MVLPAVPRDNITAHPDALRAVANLKRGGHVVVKEVPRRVGAGPLHAPLDVTEKALYAVGAWPTAETALDRMIAALEAIAENPGASS